MKDCNNVKQSPLAGLAAYGGGAGSVIFGRKGVGGYQIERSLRFNSGDQAYLNRTPSTSGNRRTFTFACWIKRSKLVNCGSSGQEIFRAGDSALSAMNFAPSDGPCDALSFKADQGGVSPGSATNAVFRDFSAWFHVVYRIDTTQSTASNRVRLYVNGVEQTWHTTNYPSQNQELKFNQSGQPHYIGGKEYLDGYLADIHFIDGQSLGPSSFGETNDDGIWDPKEFDGSFGTNGFKLNFSTNNLGQDSSGNSNNFTVNNIEATSPAATTSNITNISTSGSNQILTFTNNTGLQYFVAGDVVGTKTTTNLFSTGAGSNLNNLIAATSSATEYINDGNAYVTTQIWGGSGNISFSANYASGEGFPTNSGDEFRQNDPSGFNFDYMTVNFADGTTQNASLSNNVWTLATNGRSVRGISTQFFTSFSPGSTKSFDSFEIYDSGGNKRTMSIYGTGDAAVVSVAPLSSQMTVEAGNFTTGTTLSKTAVVGDDSFDSPVESTGSDTGAGGEVSGNYATLNPLNYRTSTTYSNGNLQLASSANYKSGVSTIGMNGGKYYFEGEILTNSDNGYSMIGVTTDPSVQNYPGAATADDGFGWYSANGQLYYNDNVRETYSSYTVGDIVAIAYDSATRKCWIAKNGTWQNSGNPAAGTGSVYTVPGSGTVFFAFATGTNGVVSVNFGQRAFAHTAPSGFKALCTTNLPTPTIADGSAYFEAKTYTGNGSTQAITGLNFSPDAVWIKSRDFGYDHALFDSVRGALKRLRPNQTHAEGTDSTTLTSFDSNGFTTGSDEVTNKNNDGYIAWAWNAGANSNKTYTVKVVSDSGNKYRFDDFGTSAVTLDLAEGSTYIFDQSDSSNSGHPLRFSTTSNGTHGGGTEYTTGVTVTGTPGQAGAKTTIVVAASAPTLFYYCSVHSGMGGQANTNSTAGASNFDGSIQATVKANQTSGFSIVTYTGAGSTATIGHGLNAEPHWVIVKPRNGTTTYGWRVYHKSVGNTKHLRLDTTSDGSVYSDWNDTTPTSSVISLNGGPAGTVNVNGTDYLCYAWAPIEGYSAFGSYTGNGQSDGPFVHTLFRPRFVIIKNTNLSTQNWYILDSERDSHNLTAKKLEPNTANTENASPNTATTNALDFLSNGFKCRTSNDGTNQNNASYVYAAFAEYPFKTARAR